MFCTDTDVQRISDELERLTCTLPRESIIRQSLAKSFAVRVNTLEEAIEFSNAYAPEHLIVNVRDASRYVSSIRFCYICIYVSFQPGIREI